MTLLSSNERQVVCLLWVLSYLKVCNICHTALGKTILPYVVDKYLANIMLMLLGRRPK